MDEEAAEPAGQVVDLMAALEQSVQKARHARGEDGEPAAVHDLPTRATRKTATQKAAAKKTAATGTSKKATGKKTPPKSGRKTKSA